MASARSLYIANQFIASVSVSGLARSIILTATAGDFKPRANDLISKHS